MGLLDKASKIGGLLGMGGPAQGQPGLVDLGLSLLSQGPYSAAGYALDARAAARRKADLAPLLEQLQSTFQPQTQIVPGQVMEPQGMQSAPVATEQGGLLQRHLQSGPALQGAPSMETTAPSPSIADLAPLLMQFQAKGADTTPITGLLGAMADERQANQPKIFNTGDSLQSYDPTNRSLTPLYHDPAKPLAAPVGYRFKADGVTLEYVPGGPADPKTIQTGSETRRSVLVRNPLPSRARASSGGSSGVGMPWKKGWTP